MCRSTILCDRYEAYVAISGAEENLAPCEAEISATLRGRALKGEGRIHSIHFVELSAFITLMVVTFICPRVPNSGVKIGLPEGYKALALVQKPYEDPAAARGGHMEEEDDFDDDSPREEEDARAINGPSRHAAGGQSGGGPPKAWVAVASAPNITIWGHDSAPGRCGTGMDSNLRHGQHATI
jgi:hypothetical protein